MGPNGLAVTAFRYPSTTVPAGELSPGTQGRTACPGTAAPGLAATGGLLAAGAAAATAGPDACTAGPCTLPVAPAVATDRSIRSSSFREICLPSQLNTTSFVSSETILNSPTE